MLIWVQNWSNYYYYYLEVHWFENIAGIPYVQFLGWRNSGQTIQLLGYNLQFWWLILIMNLALPNKFKFEPLGSQVTYKRKKYWKVHFITNYICYLASSKFFFFAKTINICYLVSKLWINAHNDMLFIGGEKNHIYLELEICIWVWSILHISSHSLT